jgi:hypothetical protein
LFVNFKFPHDRIFSFSSNSKKNEQIETQPQNGFKTCDAKFTFFSTNTFVLCCFVVDVVIVVVVVVSVVVVVDDDDVVVVVSVVVRRKEIFQVQMSMTKDPDIGH